MIFISYSNIISPLGFSTAENYRAVSASEVGVKKILLPFSSDPFCVAKIEDEKIKEQFSKIGGPGDHTKLEQLSILSIQNVIDQSGIDVTGNRTLLIYSTTKGNIDILENAYKNIDPKRAYLPVFAKHLQSFFNLAHTPLVLSNACISGILAIIVAKRFIEQGTYDHVLVCGGDVLSEFTISGFKSFNALSPEPSKPFDANRIGINLGEAVSTILITNKTELAKPYNTHIVSGASANDANHISGPSRTGDGLFQCLTEILKDNKDDIGFISAHGTATPFNDEMEAIAFNRLGLEKVPVNSLKGYYGHTLGASGLLETVIGIESMNADTLFASMGFDEIGVSQPINVIAQHEQKGIDIFLKTASGFGGCNTAVLFQKVK